MKMKGIQKMRGMFLFLAAGLAICLLATPVSAEAVKTIKIGIVGPMKFVQGEHAWYGAEIAAEEINSAGGIQVGKEKMKVELVKVDTNEILSVVDASTAIERAITSDKVDFIIGGCSSGAILAMQDVTAEYKKIFLICGSGSHPEITDRVGKDYETHKYFFRPAPINARNIVTLELENVAEIARVLKKNLGIEKPKVALLFEAAKWLDPQIPYYQKLFPKMGIEVVGLWRMSIKAMDVSAELQAIRASGAHIILAMTSGPVAIPLYRQIGELQIPAAVTGVNVEAEGAKFWEATGGMCVYGGVSAQRSDVAMTERTLPFYKKFWEKYNERPTLTSGSYDSLLILKEGIERAGSLDPDKVVAALEKTDFYGTMGRVIFDKNHDATFGPGYLTGVGIQWLPGEKIGTYWPHNWKGMTYEGVQDFQFSPWMVKYWKSKK
jgi:branched-chain amino acid transport system substrate-binding protein